MSKDYHKMQALRHVLATSPKIKALLNLTRQILTKFKHQSEQHFLKSLQLGFLIKEMEKMHITEIEELLEEVSNPETIIALPLSIENGFTLFFVIVPQGQMFNWHDHPKMIGLTKCVFGKLRITSIDRSQLQEKNNLLYYPTQSLRIEELESKSDVNLSVVYPHKFNVHKIQAMQCSAFFDLLMPDYPDDVCSFLNTIQEKDGALVLEKLEAAEEDIKGFDVVLKELSEVKKVENIILK